MINNKRRNAQAAHFGTTSYRKREILQIDGMKYYISNVTLLPPNEFANEVKQLFMITFDK